jgi:hypothetical protein
MVLNEERVPGGRLTRGKSLDFPFQRTLFQTLDMESDFIFPTQPWDHKKSPFFCLVLGNWDANHLFKLTPPPPSPQKRHSALF